MSGVETAGAAARTASPLRVLMGCAALLAVGSAAPAHDDVHPSTPPALAAMPRAAAALVDSSAAPTWVEMHNVDFRVADDIVLHIHRLDGDMHGRAGVVDFDDPTSYVTTVRSAEVSLRGVDLGHLMNDHVFAYRGAPLRHLRIELHGGEIWQRGILHKGVDIPFQIASTPSLMADGRIRLHPTRIRIFGVNGFALMRALGLSLARMLDLSRARGVAVHGNDLLLDATASLPPPAIRGRLSSVRVAGDALLLEFGTPADSAAVAARRIAPPDSSARNYMYYRGGTLHFTKLFMTNAEMLVVDADERDAFDFDEVHYQRQLIAGESRTLPDLGLEVRMPDARTLARASR